MKRFNKYYSIIVFTTIMIIASIVVNRVFPGFLQSNSFVAVVTFLVGLFALYLYIEKKEDFKKEAARILLMEIRYAERIINEKLKSLPTANPWSIILPTNNWTKFNYLFISDFNIDDLELINNFYNDCALIDRASFHMDIGLQLNQKSNYLQEGLASLAKNSTTQLEYDEKKKNFLELFHKESYLFESSFLTNKIDETLKKIKFITTSETGTKLKEICRHY